MNKERRIRLQSVLKQLEIAKDILEEILNEEQEYYDNMPESIQSSQKGEDVDIVIENLTGAFDSLEEAIDSIIECEEGML